MDAIDYLEDFPDFDEQRKMTFLTKTAFIIGRSCPRKLFYIQNRHYANKLKDDPMVLASQEAGFLVGEIAKIYHPNGIEITTLDNDQAILETQKLLMNENITLYEAAVNFGNLLARADVLIKNGTAIELNEVKSISIDSTDYSFLTKKGFIASEYQKILYDVAFQAYVIKNAFPDSQITANLILVDRSKKTSTDGLYQLFDVGRDLRGRPEVKSKKKITKEDLGEELLVKIPVNNYIDMIWQGTDSNPNKSGDEERKSFSDQIAEYAQIFTTNVKPTIMVGEKCKHCEYRVSSHYLKLGEVNGFEECWKDCLGWTDTDFKNPHIFDLWNLRSLEKFLNEKVYFLKDIDIKSNFMKENNAGELEFKSKTAERQVLQITQSLKKQQKEVVDPGLFEKIKNFTFPLYFMDFETTRLVIPNQKGRRPYEGIAFQFSVHRILNDGTVEHNAEWISADLGIFPNYEFVRQLKKALNDEGTIFCYAEHENSILREIYTQITADKANIPDASELLQWIDSVTTYKDENGNAVCGKRCMVDMCELVKLHYYHPKMKGSNSIKVVLPAVFQCSKFLRTKYAHPYFSNNFKEGIVWLQFDTKRKVKNPYDLLYNSEKDSQPTSNKLKINKGNTTAIAYTKMQQCTLDQEERQEIVKDLLRYCELDTLAMVMIFEHWNALYVNSK